MDATREYNFKQFSDSIINNMPDVNFKMLAKQTLEEGKNWADANPNIDLICKIVNITQSLDSLNHPFKINDMLEYLKLNSDQLQQLYADIRNGRV